jgi:hypothetical protein
LKHLPVLITDSCVLIDYARSSIETLTRLCETTKVYVPRILLVEEVQDLTIAEAERIGLGIVDPPTELVQKAAGLPGPLSFYDWLCVLMASENRWTCVSNDKKLRTECRGRGVKTQWSLEPLVLLVTHGTLARDKAITTARAIAEMNSYLSESIVDRFVKRLESLR